LNAIELLRCAHINIPSVQEFVKKQNLRGLGFWCIGRRIVIIPWKFLLSATLRVLLMGMMMFGFVVTECPLFDYSEATGFIYFIFSLIGCGLVIAFSPLMVLSCCRRGGACYEAFDTSTSETAGSNIVIFNSIESFEAAMQSPDAPAPNKSIVLNLRDNTAYHPPQVPNRIFRFTTVQPKVFSGDKFLFYVPPRTSVSVCTLLGIEREEAGMMAMMCCGSTFWKSDDRITHSEESSQDSDAIANSLNAIELQSVTAANEASSTFTTIGGELRLQWNETRLSLVRFALFAYLGLLGPNIILGLKFHYQTPSALVNESCYAVVGYYYLAACTLMLIYTIWTSRPSEIDRSTSGRLFVSYTHQNFGSMKFLSCFSCLCGERAPVPETRELARLRRTHRADAFENILRGTWMDVIMDVNLRPDDSLSSFMMHGIWRSHVFLCLNTTEYMKSKYCRAELLLASTLQARDGVPKIIFAFSGPRVLFTKEELPLDNPARIYDADFDVFKVGRVVDSCCSL
jgi:hypothetical protein